MKLRLTQWDRATTDGLSNSILVYEDVGRNEQMDGTGGAPNNYLDPVDGKGRRHWRWAEPDNASGASKVIKAAGCAVAETDVEGNFTLTHTSGANGAEVGDYLVELRSPKGHESEFYASVPENYTNGSGLAATISGDNPQFELILKNSRKRK